LACGGRLQENKRELGPNAVNSASKFCIKHYIKLQKKFIGAMTLRLLMLEYLLIINKLSNMKAVILAGGLGTRLSEETNLKPKPMVEIGGKPILWHLMKMISFYGINDFIICCGYKGYHIKEYFHNYHLRNSDITFNTENHSLKVHRAAKEKWNVTCVDTGEATLTGGRLKRVKSSWIQMNHSYLPMEMAWALLILML